MIGGSLTSLDVAAGTVLPAPERAHEALPRFPLRGRQRGGARGRRADLVEPREALEAAILPALVRPPCLVSFSGGRDSAAVLAAAVALARREGLPAPVPATNVFPSIADADEDSWQELVVRHLGLTDWIRIAHGDELDLIGPYAERVLTTHGLLWPANVHFHLPLLELAQGGSMLTGIGGDELFGAARRLRATAVLYGGARPRPRDVLTFGLALAPPGVRRAVIKRQATLELPWLRPHATRLATRLLVAEAASEPLRTWERILWWRRSRYMRVAIESLDLIGADTGTAIVHPLMSKDFWRAVATTTPDAGYASRTEGMERLFGDLLPRAVIARSSKANFDHVFWTDRSRGFARDWGAAAVPGTGQESQACGDWWQWVDTDELARHWASERPTLPSSTLLQAAWLASGAERLQKETEGAVQ